MQLLSRYSLLMALICIWATAIHRIASAAELSLQVCLSTGDQTWTEQEQAIWRDLCAGRPAVFPHSSDTVPNVRAGFLSSILDADHSKVIPTRKIIIDGARTQEAINVVGLTVDKISFIGAVIRFIKFDNPQVGGFVVENSDITNIGFERGELSDVAISKSSLGSASFASGSISSEITIANNVKRLLFYEMHLGDVWLAGSPQIDDLRMFNSTVDRTLGSANALFTHIVIKDSQIKKDLDISRARFVLDPTSIAEINIDNTAIERVGLPRIVPEKVTINGLSFSNWILDVIVTRNYMRLNSAYNPKLLDDIASAYRKIGDYAGVREIQYFKASKEYDHSALVNRALMFISWMTVGYGLYPEIGFLWISALVISGYFVFRTGKVSGHAAPRSWLVYSIDTILPFIELDKKHKDINFSGWRQYFVYVMRMISVVVVYLLFRVLQNAIVT